VLHSQRSSPLLSPFVRAYAQRTIAADAPLQVLPPRLEQTLNFDFGTPVEVWTDGEAPFPSPAAVVVGAHDHGGLRLRLMKGVESFSIFFRPSGFSQLFGVPSVHLANTHAEADALLGPALHRVREQMGSTSSFQDRVAIVERFLIGRRDHATSSIITVAANELLRLRGRPSVSPFARAFGLDIRQFERRFLREIGMSPKRFARIARFQTALDWKLARPSTTWREIAHDLGYHDQMHLVHDFSKLGGYAPGEMLAGLGDSRPPALVTNDHQ
jgi:AraC-like DNA-binding protein